VVVLLALQILRYQFITAFPVVLVVVRQKVERLEVEIHLQLLRHKEITGEPQAVMEAQEVAVLAQLESAQQLLMVQQAEMELRQVLADLPLPTLAVVVVVRSQELVETEDLVVVAQAETVVLMGWMEQLIQVAAVAALVVEQMLRVPVKLAALVSSSSSAINKVNDELSWSNNY
jgi:hypothetical protein